VSAPSGRTLPWSPVTFALELMIRLLTLTLSFLGTTVSFAQELPSTFWTGTYKQEGRCTKLTRLERDQSGKCKPWLGVLVQREDRPEFMFFYDDKSYRVFVASEGAKYVDGNRSILYQLGNVLDLESMKKVEVFGECALTTRTGAQAVKCSAWNDKERTDLLFVAEFEGNGQWLYKPQRVQQ
jgi:hypothetical protein